jgi:hypothetical protein
MNALGLNAAALTGTVALLAGAPDLALWGTCAASLASIIVQLLRSWDDRRRDERRHKYETEDRAAADHARQLLQRGIDENTALTREGIDSSNHVNDKFAMLARAALATDRATQKRDTDDIRRDIRDLK